MPPRVSALHARPRGLVEVDLDGQPWRTLPAEVVLMAGLDVDVELDRPRARRVGRELRRHQAQTRALRALGRRELSTRELGDHLARARVAPALREAVVAGLSGAGAVDDAGLARRRAELLAERGSGDALIRHDLAAKGISEDLIATALAALAPESERARWILEKRGRSPKTVRYLARKGFSEDVCEEAVAENAPPAVR